MRILNENGVEITEAEANLSIGYCVEEVIVSPDAPAVDDVTKFAYADGDYETIRRYIRIPDAELTRQRIAVLKQKLSDTDYCVIKIAEGVASVDEYTDILAQREDWRAEINELEVQANG